MLLNVPDSSLLVAQPLGCVVPTQFLDEFFGATRDVPRKVDGVDTLQEKTHYFLVNTNANQGFSMIVYWSSFLNGFDRQLTPFLPS